MVTLYEKLNGIASIDTVTDMFLDTAVEILYSKILADDRISHFFDKIDVDKQVAKQKAFLTMVIGGPNYYTGKSIKEAHKHLVENGLNDTHVDIFIKHLGDTLRELRVDEGDIAEVIAIANSARDDVLNR